MTLQERDIEELVDLLGDGHLSPGPDGQLTVALDPFGFRWFRVRRRGQRLPAVAAQRRTRTASQGASSRPSSASS